MGRAHAERVGAAAPALQHEVERAGLRPRAQESQALAPAAGVGNRHAGEDVGALVVADDDVAGGGHGGGRLERDPLHVALGTGLEGHVRPVHSHRAHARVPRKARRQGQRGRGTARRRFRPNAGSRRMKSSPTAAR